MSQPPEAAPPKRTTCGSRPVKSHRASRGSSELVTFISGEGGRWASNGTSNAQIPWNGGWLLGEQRPGLRRCPQRHGDDSVLPPQCDGHLVCRRRVECQNLACSGAMTTSFVNIYDRAKPGIDFAQQTTKAGTTFVGQAQLLQDFAKDHDVKAVALSIGGNDLGFADIIATCLTDWVVGTTCSNSDFSRSHQSGGQGDHHGPVYQAIENVNKAMTTAGYKPDQWRLMIQLPPRRCRQRRWRRIRMSASVARSSAAAECRRGFEFRQ